MTIIRPLWHKFKRKFIPSSQLWLRRLTACLGRTCQISYYSWPPSLCLRLGQRLPNSTSPSMQPFFNLAHCAFRLFHSTIDTSLSNLCMLCLYSYVRTRRLFSQSSTGPHPPSIEESSVSCNSSVHDSLSSTCCHSTSS